MVAAILTGCWKVRTVRSTVWLPESSPMIFPKLCTLANVSMPAPCLSTRTTRRTLLRRLVASSNPDLEKTWVSPFFNYCGIDLLRATKLQYSAKHMTQYYIYTNLMESYLITKFRDRTVTGHDRVGWCHSTVMHNQIKLELQLHVLFWIRLDLEWLNLQICANWIELWISKKSNKIDFNSYQIRV